LELVGINIVELCFDFGKRAGPHGAIKRDQVGIGWGQKDSEALDPVQSTRFERDLDHVVAKDDLFCTDHHEGLSATHLIQNRLGYLVHFLAPVLDPVWDLFAFTSFDETIPKRIQKNFVNSKINQKSQSFR
jgi:hypothetical protein